VKLAGIDGEVFEPVDLRLLDLGVPIGALDQANHDAAIAALRQVDDEIEDIGSALAIGLDHEAEPVPA
jgi:hypothetical protein